MRFLLFYYLILITSLIEISCISQQSLPLKGKAESNVSTGQTKLSKNQIENIILSKGYVVSWKDESDIAFQVDVTDKWTWEDKNGIPLNQIAYVVIKKYKDIGANRILKPSTVIGEWIIQVKDGRYSLKGSKVKAIYQTVMKVTDDDAGYSIGKFEPVFIKLIESVTG